VEAFDAIGRHVYGVGLLAQAFGQESGDPSFVFHQQNSHALSILLDCG
jgi:hypothetical protein